MKFSGWLGVFAALGLGMTVLGAQEEAKVGEDKQTGDVLPREDEESVEPDVEEEGNEQKPGPEADGPNPSNRVEHAKVYGWKEWILFEGKTQPMRAKFDSGALTSSIHAENVKEVEKDGQKWVRFTVVDPKGGEKKGDPVVYECRLMRVAKIRNADGQRSERKVVEMTFWIGGEKRRAEFTLNDRGDMLNPVLLGRSVVQTMGLIDVGRTYLMGTNPKAAPVQAPPEGEAEQKNEESEPDKKKAA